MAGTPVLNKDVDWSGLADIDGPTDEDPTTKVVIESWPSCDRCSFAWSSAGWLLKARSSACDVHSVPESIAAALITTEVLRISADRAQALEHTSPGRWVSSADRGQAREKATSRKVRMPRERPPRLPRERLREPREHVPGSHGAPPGVDRQPGHEARAIRRARVAELLSTGMRQKDMAQALDVSVYVIHDDVMWVRAHQ